MTGRRKYLVTAAVAAVTLGLDQWTKVLARQILRPLMPGRYDVIEGFWFHRYSENAGIAFGMFQAQTLVGRVVLSTIAATACGIVVHYLRRTTAGQTRLQLALALVGGGALGNLLDRILFGRVTDFIVWHYRKYEWPAFNVADAALVIGVVLMAFDMFPRREASDGDPGPAPPASQVPSATESGTKPPSRG